MPAWQRWALGFLLVFAALFLVYGPSLRGEFVFDDLNLPNFHHQALSWPIQRWWGVRPLLMTTFWVNMHLSGLHPFPYHVINVFFHACAGILLFFCVRKLLEFAQTRAELSTVLAALAAGIFLLHPLQTEAVSYIAQRGENLGAVFYLSAFCVFLYRRPGPVSWARTIAVLFLLLAAITTKEHTVTLPALLLLTDYYWNPGFSLSGIRKNWRLYGVMAVGLAAGSAFVWNYISRDTTSIGFRLQEFTAPQYLFTQFRVFFAYLGLFLYPFWQSIDYDISISRSLLDHGSAIALVCILLLLGAAWRYRRRYPLASYGLLVFVLLLLPTSSIVPILDPMADRRVYLPMLGLVLIPLEFLRRLKITRDALVGIAVVTCLVLGAATYSRNQKWASARALWADAVDKAPTKPRVLFGLAVSQVMAGQCRQSIPYFEKAIALSPPNYQFFMDLGMAYDCDHQPGRALQALQRSIDLRASAESYSSLAFVQAKTGQLDPALESLKKAEALNPGYAMTYVYRGGIYQVIGRFQDAAAEYRRALLVDPGNNAATQALQTLGRGLGPPQA